MEYAIPAHTAKRMMQALMDLVKEKNYTVNYIGQSSVLFSS